MTSSEEKLLLPHTASQSSDIETAIPSGSDTAPSRRERLQKGFKFASLFAISALCFLLFRHLSISRSQDPQLLSARSLLSDQWAGLDPAYEIDQQEIRLAGDSDKTVPGENRTLDDDFRQIRFAKVSQVPAPNAYRGHTCLSHYPGQVCPWPGACAPPDPDSEEARLLIEQKGACIHWRQGKLAKPIQVDEQDVIAAREKQTVYTPHFDTDGQWVDNTWIPTLETPHKGNYRFFTPQDMHRCFMGKRVLIQGDSMSRQLMNRLIVWSRGIPTVAEHYYGGIAAYTVFMDGTDEWALYRDNDASLYSRERDTADHVLFRIFFNWQPDDLNDLDAFFQPLVNLDVDVGVLAMSYWYPLSYDFSHLPEAFDKFYERTKWDGVLAWYATPQEYSGKDAWWHLGENALIRGLFTDRREREGRKMLVLPSDRMVASIDAAGYPQRNCRHEGQSVCYHDAHFASVPLDPCAFHADADGPKQGCGIRSYFPGQIQPGLDGFKAPRGLDCRDTYNFAVLQNLLNAICPG